MNNLKEIIESTPELSDLDYPSIAAWFNDRPIVDNPEPQGQVQKPFSVPELLGLLAEPQDKAVIEQSMTLVKMGNDIADMIGRPNQHTAESLFSFFVGQGLSEASTAAISARMAETIPDPNYQAQIPGLPRYETLEINGPVTPEQVQGALN